MLGVQRGTLHDNGLAHTHRGHEEPHHTLASVLHGWDRPMHMTAAGGRSSQPLYIRHMALDGSLPDVADPVNVGYLVTGPSLAGHFGDKHITHGRSTRPRPTPPQVPDFTPEDVYNADSDKLRAMLMQIQSTVPDLQSNPFWISVTQSYSGDSFKNEARVLVMHWANVYGAGNNGSVNAAGEYQAWLNTIFDPDDQSGGTNASGTTLTPDWSSLIDYWAPTVQSEIASGSPTSAMVASLQQGAYYPTAQTGEALDFSQIGDNWNWLKTNARQTALSIGAELAATTAGNPSGFQKLPDQPIRPDLFSDDVKKSDNYVDSRMAYGAALGMALSKVRVSYLAAVNAPPPAPSDLPDIAVLVGVAGVGGLLLWWWMK
mgnify:CR=1 FL=1